MIHLSTKLFVRMLDLLFHAPCIHIIKEYFTNFYQITIIQIVGFNTFPIHF